jgi:3-oxoadipate enol-lactonase
MSMIASPPDGFIDVPGARLYVETFGTPAAPALVLMHAGIADRTMWDPQTVRFAREHFVIRYDLRGFGRTETIDCAFSDRADVIALLDHFGIQRATLVGCSRAGSIALDTTIEYPERVNGLVWVCGGLGGMSYSAKPDDPREIAFSAIANAYEDAEKRQDWAQVTDFEVRIFADGLGQPEGRCRADVRDKIRAMCLANYAAAHTKGSPIKLDPPAATRLGEVNARTLVVLGDLDEWYTEQAANHLASGIAGATLAVMRGTAHMPSMEQPDAFNQLLAKFLGEIGD